MTDPGSQSTFCLKRYALGRQPSIQITEPEYRAIVSAKQRVLDSLVAEELLDLLMGNYEDFERELLALALRQAIYMGAEEEWSDSIDTIQLVSRRLANFLSTAQGYCDQVPHLVSSLFGRDSDQLASIRAAFSHEYDSVLGYRVCTELRRYVQHRGMAVHGYSGASKWIDRPDGRHVRIYSFAPEISVVRLKEDSRFKAAVLDALEATGRLIQSSGDRVCDVRPFVRDYVSALGRIHLKLRALVVDDTIRHDSIILDAIQRYSALPAFDGLIGLAAMELNERGLREGHNPTFVMREPIDRRLQLARKNHLPTHFDTQVITNELELS